MSFSSEENHFNAGEKALESGNYKSAIAHFQKVLKTTQDQSLLSSAQKLLVSAYLKTGQTKEAINLCQHLQNSGNVQDQVWATTQLNQLNQAQNSTNLTGFVADTSPASSTTKQSLSQQPISKPLSSQRQLPSSRFSSSKKTVETNDTQQKKQTKNTSIIQEKTETKSQSSTLQPIKIQWRNAPGAKQWKPWKQVSFFKFGTRMITSLVVFFGVFRLSIQLLIEITNTLLVELPYFEPFQPFYGDPTIALIFFIAIIFLVSPWLLNTLLKFCYQSQQLPIYKLVTRCPAAGKFLQKSCQQQKLPLPKLKILPTNAPLIFSYGQIPKNAQIIISEGLLTQLTDEEVATVLAGELGMIRYFPLCIFSGAIALLQVPYTLYWQISHWGETIYQYLPKTPPRFLPNWIWRDIPPLTRNSAAFIATFFYLNFRLWQFPLNWLFQAQHSYRDQFSLSLTGDPNAKVRALMKIAMGMTHEIETQKQTPFLLEGFNGLFPIGYRQGLHLGSLSRNFSLETILSWESSQGYRHQLNWFQSHPLISDRAFNLLQFAKRYQLPLELDISRPTPPVKGFGKQVQKLITTYQVLPLFQLSLYVGLALGILLRLMLWGIGFISEQLNVISLAWLTEAESLLAACTLMIFSLAIIMGTNHYFPDIKVSNTNNNPSLAQWLTTINHPQQVYSLRMNGQLFGRGGISNWLGQDLILKTETGTIFLHVSSRLGIIGNILPNFPRPNQFIQQSIIVSGWLRRGIIPWIDVERITNHQRHSLRAGYPIWLTILAVVAAIWGTQLILQG